MAIRRRLKRRMAPRRRRRMPLKMMAKKKIQIARNLGFKSDLHYISRYAPSVDTTTLTTTTTFVGAAIAFALTDINNPTEFSNLFDKFKLIGVQCTFRLMDNPDSTYYVNNVAFSQGSNFYPKLWWVIDRDDTGTPSLTTIRERGAARCAILRPDRVITVFVKNPRPLLSTSSGIGTLPSPNSFLRTIESGVPTSASHLGLKVVLDKMGYSGHTFTVGIDKKYFFAFKDSR